MGLGASLFCVSSRLPSVIKMAARSSRTGSRKPTPNVQTTLDYFQSLLRELESEKESYIRKRATLGIQVFVVIEDYIDGVPSTPE